MLEAENVKQEAGSLKSMSCWSRYGPKIHNNFSKLSKLSKVEPKYEICEGVKDRGSSDIDAHGPISIQYS